MHHSSLLTMRQMLKRHLATDPVLSNRALRVLDVGGADYNGSYRPLFERTGADYMAVDITAGPGVDLVMSSDGRIDLESGSFDIVVSGQTFEHAWNFWELFAEMVRLCRPDGLVIVIAPSSGAEHRYPVDCYRFLPDSYQALADAHGIALAECFMNPFGPFFDLAGVFRPGGISSADGDFCDRRIWAALDDPVQNAVPEVLDPAAEQMSGSMPTGEFLGALHRRLLPRNYLEIGVEYGTSLVRADCNAIGVDPSPNLRRELADHHRVMEMTSEDFFMNQSVADLLAPLDLAFIDGMHLIEHAVTEFMWVEQHSHPATVVVIDDIFPNHPVQAERMRRSKAWVGDVWKIVDLLRFNRTDLLTLIVDTYPTGCAVVIGLSPESTVFWRAFDTWLRDQMVDLEVPDRALTRRGALAPEDPLLWRVIDLVRAGRESGGGPRIEDLQHLVRGALPRTLVPGAV